ncbi:MAG TPA: [protein-PII] uridylyltransferase, partial [Chromatiales bacterium]|nr:[protein-PII] uridylyltransferase [Chromatiales bacterium]
MPALPLPDSLQARLDESELSALAHWEGAATSRERVERLHEQLDTLFDEGFDVADLVVARAAIADRVLTGLWRHHGLERQGAVLVAVGGYGRGELHPGSDIDLLLLFDAEPDQTFGEAISAFLTTLWDIRYQVGHSVRTLDECVREATDDVTVATNLMEARTLAGDAALFEEMMHRTAPPAVWPSADFFRAKLAEQEERHRRFGDTAYRLEPNIKESPGGLRDIQMIGWVTKRHFGARSLEELLHRGFLERDEYEALMAGERYLWRLRYALHRLSGRKEDRLLFDYQKTLALQFGHQDGPGNLAVESFMQHYYRTITELGRLNEMLLQLYDEEILHADEPAEVVPVNA